MEQPEHIVEEEQVWQLVRAEEHKVHIPLRL